MYHVYNKLNIYIAVNKHAFGFLIMLLNDLKMECNDYKSPYFHKI